MKMRLILNVMSPIKGNYFEGDSFSLTVSLKLHPFFIILVRRYSIALVAGLQGSTCFVFFKKIYFTSNYKVGNVVGVLNIVGSQ